jgi:small-conductance mechanosensitive channel
VNELADLLLHPARWANDASVLRPSTRLYIALLTLAVTALTSAIVGWVSSRWARRRTAAAPEDQERNIRRVKRGLRLVTIFLGIYLAVEVAPLPLHLDEVISAPLFVLGAFVMARLVIHLSSLLLSSSVTHVGGSERSRLQREYVPLIEKVLTLAVAMVWLIVVAKHFGKDVTSLVAALGVGSLAIGLAAQQTLGNMIAGFVLLVDRPFRVADRVKLATGETGEVREIGVRSTRILLGDGNLLVVPNAELANSRVVNFIAAAHSDLKFWITTDNDVEQVITLLHNVAKEDQRIKKCYVRLSGVSDHGLELTVGIDCDNVGDAWNAEGDLRRRSLSRLKAENVRLTDLYGLYKSSQGVPKGSPL